MAEALGAWPTTADRDRHRAMRGAEPVARDPDSGMWLVYRYEDAARVLTDHAAFTSEYASSSALVSRLLSGRDPVVITPAMHRELRRTVSRRFTPGVVAALGSRVLTVTTELLDRVAGDERIDLATDLAFPLPVRVIAELLGVPQADMDSVLLWVDTLCGNDSQPPLVPVQRRVSACDARAELLAYLYAHVAEYRRNSASDLTAEFLATEIDGMTPDDDQAVALLGLVLLSGHLTTTSLLASVVLSLDDFPAASDEVRAFPELLAPTIEEVLRYRTPVSQVTRRAKLDVELGGRRVLAGEQVVVVMDSVNQDERRFPAPERFDIHRKTTSRLSTGYGLPFGPGSPVARLQTRMALELLLWRYCEISVDRAALRAERVGWITVPTSMPLRVRSKRAVHNAEVPPPGGQGSHLSRGRRHSR
ncbi:cytochrome P450 [Allokutzneria sp. A3M-2-11 16]|uniref:cytochrome P450 n=1 Tax=Allokutzneria sp. A3M-2-11 16 TaxID=2962043 RepID=UPI0020B8DDFB|nr:cytochrome P450 [Allokutzneria sp. A3M-2-11 16]MCP3797896.1 cytochrome P450 [Allokutzneria sp. A3M-2-11 16]